MSTRTGLAIGESARLVGSHVWVEERLFELLGRCVSEVNDADLKLMLDRHSLQHAEHALWWRARLPVLAGVDHDALVTATAAGAALTDLDGGLEPVREAVGDAYRRFVPAQLARYRDHLTRLSVVADAPSATILHRVIAHTAAEAEQGVTALDRSVQRG